jgi:Fe-S-cluster-containing hydrogenase component 2
MVCSLKHEGVCGPAYSRINVVKWELQGIYAPVVCQQCEDRICAMVCPVKAIGKSPETGLFIRDKRRCIGCLNCALSCPFGAISLNPITRKAHSCDLCEGDPTCVRVCPTGALLYEEQDRVNRRLRDKIADYLVYEGVLKGEQ